MAPSKRSIFPEWLEKSSTGCQPMGTAIITQSMAGTVMGMICCLVKALHKSWVYWRGWGLFVTHEGDVLPRDVWICTQLQAKPDCWQFSWQRLNYQFMLDEKLLHKSQRSSSDTSLYTGQVLHSQPAWSLHGQVAGSLQATKSAERCRGPCGITQTSTTSKQGC